MGVKELWGILAPVIRDKPLTELSGMKLAVDLSCWVCDSQSSMIHTNVTKPHLRNLFFRTACLLDLEIDLVYVMDGKAPEMKLSTMEKRNQERFGQSKGIVTNKGNRSQFKSILRECQTLLDAMGVPWVQSPGEAEKTCALLNLNKVVDGCVTEDSDVFLYGARTVYRNLATDPASFSAQECSMDSMESLGLSRDKLVVLALLLGCDYHPGIKGIGKETALKLLKSWDNGSALNMFKAWETVPCSNVTQTASKMPHCSHCKHPGSSKSHKAGCQLCHTRNGCIQHELDYECPCDWHVEMRSGKAVETLVRQKVMQDPGFPFDTIIDEFLNSKEALPEIKWKRPIPNLQSLVSIMENKLSWTREYAYEKALPLVTRWIVSNRAPLTPLLTSIQPIKVIKERVRKGVKCFEVEWDTSSVDSDSAIFTTLEPSQLFARAFPSLEPKPKQKATRKKKENASKKSQPTISHAFAKLQSQTRFSQPLNKHNSPQPRSEVEEPKFALDSQSAPVSNDPDEALIKEISSMQISVHETSHTSSMSDSDLSVIVEAIISRKPNFIFEKRNDVRSFRPHNDYDSFIRESEDANLKLEVLDESDPPCNFHLSLHLTPEPSHHSTPQRPRAPSTKSRSCLREITPNTSQVNSPNPKARRVSPSSSKENLEATFAWKTPLPLRERLKKHISPPV